MWTSADGRTNLLNTNKTNFKNDHSKHALAEADFAKRRQLPLGSGPKSAKIVDILKKMTVRTKRLALILDPWGAATTYTARSTMALDGNAQASSIAASFLAPARRAPGNDPTL